MYTIDNSNPGNMIQYSGLIPTSSKSITDLASFLLDTAGEPCQIWDFKCRKVLKVLVTFCLNPCIMVFFL